MSRKQLLFASLIRRPGTLGGAIISTGPTNVSSASRPRSDALAASLAGALVLSGGALLLCGCAVSDSVRAAQAGRTAVTSITSQSAAAAADVNAALAAESSNERRVLRPDPAYAVLPRYSGTLGGRRIEVRLGPKPAGADSDDVGGWHGEYHEVGGQRAILLAGDVDGTTLTLEESDDGTRISGVWVGQFQRDGSLIGERSEVDGSRAQPVDLRPVR
ncbi:hypothetical protein [Chitinasiproducens palmae]|uniref:Uncharacterized protein n=1 Tax=Chitinasiproducens palmae TaxID=1770053 RepID=A0A1H2PW86_9BURK|nr:hypothetical protein [Chitinasiproducens palmae]SDV51603.1 hypothetical protein SAMN05216551_11922 [Chitinasiproducens palmae]